MTNIVKASEVSFNEALIRLAAVHGKTVEFRYTKTPTSPVETRSLVPEDVKFPKDESALLFVGYCPERKGLRSFRADRIVGEVKFA